MYLYNISIIVEEGQQETFSNWLKKEWLTQVSNEIKLLKMLNSPHDGHTYCLQMIVNNEEAIHQFQEKYLADLQQYINVNHHEKIFIFDSVMQYL